MKKERNSPQSPLLSLASLPNGGHTAKLAASASAGTGKTPPSGEEARPPRPGRGPSPNGRRNASSQEASARPNGEGPRSSGKSPSSLRRASGTAPAKPTDPAAMQDAVAFVDAVAARKDLVVASVELLDSKDEKIKKAELDRLRDMKFGKVSVAGGPGDEPQQLIIDVPRPDRE